MSELRPYHNSAYGFDTDRNLPQPNQGKVNTETPLSNKLSLQKTSKKELPWKIIAEHTNAKVNVMKKLKLQKYGCLVPDFI